MKPSTPDGTRALKICRDGICITNLKRNYCKQNTYCITAHTSAEFETLRQVSKIENTRNIIPEKKTFKMLQKVKIDNLKETNSLNKHKHDYSLIAEQSCLILKTGWSKLFFSRPQLQKQILITDFSEISA